MTELFRRKGVMVKFASIFLVMISALHSWGNTAMDGAWISDCNVFGRHSFISEIQFKESNHFVTFKLYEDQSCLSHASTVSYEGSFSTGNIFGEGIEFDSLPSKVQLTVHIQNVVDQYNNPSSPDGCEMKNWQIDVAQDVSGKYCRPIQMPTIGVAVHDIYQVQDSEFRFGSIPLNWGLNDPARRPRTLSKITFHRISNAN